MPLDISKLGSPTFEELFEETKDVRYVLLALGAHPDNPPPWALAVCETLYETEQVAVPTPATGRPPKYSLEDGIALDHVADLCLTGWSPTAAVKEITGEESDGTNFRRLMRAWKRASHPKTLVLEGKQGKGNLTNKWLRRASEREHEKFLQEVFAEARRQIEAGDLNCEEDPVKKAERESKARWFSFSEKVNPDQDAQIKIAPMTREVWIKNAKKILLEKPRLLEEESAEDADDETR